MRSLAADEFRAYTGGGKKSVAYSVVLKSDGNRDFFQVHTDKCGAYVESRVRLDFFKGDRFFKSAVCGGGKGTPRFRLGYIIDGLGERNRVRFRNNCSVKVFAALRRNKNTFFLCGFKDSVEYLFCGFGGGVCADSVTHNLACGTAHNKYLPFFQSRGFHNFLCGGICL